MGSMDGLEALLGLKRVVCGQHVDLEGVDSLVKSLIFLVVAGGIVPHSDDLV